MFDPSEPADTFFYAIRDGSRKALSKAISLIESSRKEDKQKAAKLIQMLLPYAGQSQRIGISGIPGVGKSTFIEHFCPYWITEKGPLAILTIDPSSTLSGGSILGDKLRMAGLANHPDVFIRPSPANNIPGGIAGSTREAIILCEAAGFKNIFVETVGTGQTEIAVRDIVDCFLFLLMPGTGDDIQGIKKGVLEIADIFIVNKADGQHLDQAQKTCNDLQNSIQFLPSKPSGWEPPVITCSAIEKTGFETIIKHINAFFKLNKAKNTFDQTRKQQQINWMKNRINTLLEERFFENNTMKTQLTEYENQILRGTKDPLQAADELIKYFFKNINNI